MQPRCQASARKRLDLQQESAAGCCRLMLRRSPMVQWSQQKPHPVVSAQQLNVVLGHGVYHQVVQTIGTQNLNSVGMWMMHSIPGVRTCWWFSMSLGAKITILCYTFGLNRVHQVPLVYHHFPHWNWSLKVRLIFLDKLMFFPRGLFEAFFLCVCVYVCV